MSRWSREALAARLGAPLPPPPFGRALARRVVLVWLAIHVVVAVIALMSGDAVYLTFALGAQGLVWLWGFVAATILVDMRTRSEGLILANLGVPRRVVAVLVIGECAVLDAVARLVVLGGSGELRPGS